MRMMTVLMLAACVIAGADDAGVLVVKGQGAEGKPAYDGGGKLEFTDVALGAQVIHYDGGAELPMPLTIDYTVLETAPIVLTSRFGSEYWRLYHFADETMSIVHTTENINLSEAGEHAAAPEGLLGTFDEGRGPLPGKGMVGVRGHYYFLIEPADGGEWLDVVSPPAFFDQPEINRKLTFTLANLSDYSLAINEVQSTWQPGGPFRVKLTVTDADGETFPVVSPQFIEASAGDWTTALETEWTPLSEPTGWLRGTLPEGEVPEQIAVIAKLEIVTAEGPAQPEVTATFARGDGQVSAEEMTVTIAGYELPRNADGVIRETRALWVSTTDFESREATDSIVERAQRARLNALVPIIFYRNRLVAKNDLGMEPATFEDGGDPLAYLIEKAHAAGLEVHPWFCTTYRDWHFRAWFKEKYGVNVDVIDKDGEVESLPADLHRPEYRDFVVDLMIGVARDYEVDGIHHDYIRVMEDCYCDKCRAEFEAQFGKPLTEATAEEWTAWHQQAVGDVVRRVAEGVRAVRPEAKLSAAVFSSMVSGGRQGQDSPGWARQGWVDLVIPMDYAMQTLSVRARERAFLEALDDDGQLVTGLSLYQKGAGGATARSPELVAEQVEQVRRMGIHGYCLFVGGYLNDEIIAVLRDDLNAEEAVPYFR